MTQGSSDARLGRPLDSGAPNRRDQRVALLGRASKAIRQAHATADDAQNAGETSAEMEMTALENEALREAERDALRELEADVRRFANRLRREGTPPEVAVRRLKATVEPVVFASRDHDGGDVDWRRAVVGDVVRWFVEAYYAA
jgi:predicted  nucleic acid-binding Zn-ribbon protein